MGWLSSIFKSKVAEEAEGESKKDSNQIEVSELIETLSKKIEETNSSSSNDLKNFHKKMMDALHDFSKSLEELRSHKFEGKIDERIDKVGESYKSSIVKVFNNTIIEFKRPVKYEIESFNDYFRKCSSVLSDAEKSAEKFVMPLKEIFPGKTGNVIRKSGRLSNVMSGIGTDMKNRLDKLGPMKESLSLAKELVSQKGKIIDMEEERRGICSSMEEMESRREEIEGKIVDLKEEDEWKDYLDRTESLKSMRVRKEEMRNSILQDIIPMDRPMRKLKRMLSDTNSSFHHFDMLDLYIEDPVSAFLKDEKQSALAGIFLKVKGAMESGKIDMDERREHKVLEKMSSMETGGFLQDVKVDYHAVKETIKKIDADLSSAEVMERKTGHEKELESIKSRMFESRDRLDKSGSVLKKMEERKAEILKDLKSSSSSVFRNKIELKDV